MTVMSTDPKQWSVGLVGYGEVGRIIAEDLRSQDVKVSAYDLKLRSDQTGGALRDHASSHGVALANSHADLAAQADFIVSAVTASQAVPVAQACSPAVKQGAWFLDFNSASPGAKLRAAALIDGKGGRYVEGAVMTSIPPKRIKVPLLLGGSGADASSRFRTAHRKNVRSSGQPERAPLSWPFCISPTSTTKGRRRCQLSAGRRARPLLFQLAS